MLERDACAVKCEKEEEPSLRGLMQPILNYQQKKDKGSGVG